jgi:hypothetical protein
MGVQVESILPKKTVNDLLRETLIGSMAILTGLCLRDFLIAITTHLNPDVKVENLIFTFFVFMVVLLITIILCIAWN